MRKKTIFDELKTLFHLIFSPEKNFKDIIFYSSQGHYISNFEGLLNSLTIDYGYQITYVSSDPNDPIFNQYNKNITAYYSKTLISIILPLMEPKVIVMTMPDIHQYYVKRSFSGTNYVYIFHAIMSTHMIYRKGAFDHYDTILCVGPHHIEEIRQTEKLNGLQPKTLHEGGFYKLEKIYKEYQQFLIENEDDPKSKNVILIAPSWHSSNILEICGEQLIQELLLNENFTVVVRPHPMMISKNMAFVQNIQQKFSGFKNFQIDLDLASQINFLKADIMICDWSGAAMEYAFGTERPVLFIDLPKKIYNPDYEDLGIEPLEVKIREIIGKVIQPDDVDSVREILTDFIKHKEKYADQIRAAREMYIYNFGTSSKIEAEIILDILKKNIKGKSKA